ncbi:MAG: AAA family ATPase [Gammaproteobacteria bacterium]|nr:AAA family ATPase [Gammaproteobacteria bacterium]
MFKELEITNFRGFKECITVKFAPITVLIGRNNAGKSSIVKFLLMLQQSLGTGKSGFLVSRGERTDLGPFHNLKNTLSGEKTLAFSLTMEDFTSPRDSLSLYLQKKNKTLWPKNGVFQTAAEVSYSKKIPFQGKKHSFCLKIDGEEVTGRTAGISQNSNFLDFADAQKSKIDSHADSSEIAAENACLEVIAKKLVTIRHISPDKKSVPRSFDTGEFTPETDVGQDGRFALHHLWNLHEDGGQNEMDFVSQYMEKVLDVTDIRFTDPKDGDLSQCMANNQNTRANNNLADFGHGVSQCFPIFVQGALMPPYSTLICEQPESQIHSSAQLELGQYFADLWTNRKVASIIETHSDSILLRLRRLISTGKLQASDVSVVYLSVDSIDNEQSVSVRNLGIESDGSMEDGLPMEFFHPNIWELLEMVESSEE